MSTKHRISFDLSAPVKILGMTIDELALGIGGFLFFALSKNKIVGLIFFGLAVVGLIALKQFKKRTADFNVKAFLWWHLGIGSKKGTFPPSHTRRIGPCF